MKLIAILGVLSAGSIVAGTFEVEWLQFGCVCGIVATGAAWVGGKIDGDDGTAGTGCA